MNNYLQDAHGNKSSKRLVGVILITAGSILVISVGVASVFKQIIDPTTALASGKTLIYTGAALLGVGVVEKLGGKI